MLLMKIMTFAQEEMTNTSLKKILSTSAIPEIIPSSIDSSKTNITVSTTNLLTNTNSITTEISNVTLEQLVDEVIEEEKITVNYKNILDDEVPLMIREFKDIINLYQKAPSKLSSKISLYRRLLTRLNKMQPKTVFLQNHRDLLKNSIRLFLGLRDKGDSCLKKILKNSPYTSIKNDVLSVLISYHYQNGEIYRLNSLLETHQNSLDQEQKSNVTLIVRSFTSDISTDEASVLLKMMHTPLNLYQHAGFKSKLLNNIQEKLHSDDIYRSINVSFYNDDKSLALALIRLQIKKINVDIATLAKWGNQLKNDKRYLVETLRIYQHRSEDYKLYVKNYHSDRRAYTRGRIFHRRLYAYRGESNAPYNVLLAQRTLDEYLKGVVEINYIEENAKRAFRSFLAYKKYDLIRDYAVEMRSRVTNQVAPYVNFWGAYALLQNGQTNDAIPFLGEILTVAPESYWGILAQSFLKNIFSSIPLSQSRYFNSLREKSVNSKKDLLDYAYISYYLGNRIAKGRAENIFFEEGLIVPSQNPRISSEKNFLIQAYSKLNLTRNIRPLIFNEGITNIHDQNVLLMKVHQQNEDISEIIGLLAQGYRALLHKTSFMLGNRAMKAYFPLPYQEHFKAPFEKRTMDKYLLYSVMRIESFYKEKARSRAGASGLMQIMPVTGRWLVKRYLPELKEYSLYEPALNIYLGSLYLYENIDKIGIIPALAAYNSGPTFVNKLIAKYLPNTDLELAEIHPKKETRNYVRKVIHSYQLYTQIYNSKPYDFLQL